MRLSGALSREAQPQNSKNRILKPLPQPESGNRFLAYKIVFVADTLARDRRGNLHLRLFGKRTTS